MAPGTETVTEQRHAGGPQPAPARRARSLVPWLSVLILVATAVVGSNAFAVRDHLFGTATPNAAPPAAGRAAGSSTQDTIAAAPTSLRSSPWWQDVTTLEGTGATTSPVTIGSGAIQWRVTATCQAGRLVVQAPKRARPVLDAACGQDAVGYGVGTGAVALQITADGPWRIQVAQQIDTPLVEPPLREMTAPGAAAILTGSLYNIDKVGTGKVTVYRQPDGRYSVRLEDFFVSPNTDLELRLSTLEAPHGSQEVANARSELVVVMDVTAGSLNYAVPAGVDPTQFKSVVIWCRPISSAYAAATLGAAR